MKTGNKKRLEAIVQELLNVPVEENQDRMDSVKQRAFEEYAIRMRQAESRRSEPKTGQLRMQKSLGQRLMTAVALALAILVLPIVVTMLSPVPIGNADDDWGRYIVIWLNNTFQTELRIPESVSEQGKAYEMEPGKEQAFSSVKEAARVLNTALPALGNGDIHCELQSVTVMPIDDGIYRVTEQYLMNDVEIIITLKTVLSSQIEAPIAEAVIIASEACDLYAWETDDSSKAFGVFDDWLVILIAECKLVEAADLFSTMYTVN